MLILISILRDSILIFLRFRELDALNKIFGIAWNSFELIGLIVKNVT